jgi:serine/threonine protein kinase
VNTVRHKAGEHERKAHVLIAAKVLLRSCTPDLHNFAGKLTGFQEYIMQFLHLKLGTFRSHRVCVLLAANVLLHSQTPNPHGFAAKLADFGASVRVDMEAPSSENNSLRGTFTHVAPEVVDGQPCSKVGRSLGPADYIPMTYFLMTPDSEKPYLRKLSGGHSYFIGFRARVVGY